MANPTLFKSAALVGSYHIFLAMAYAPIFFTTVITIGVITSLYNHGTTSLHAQWLDRIAIFLACLVDIVYFAIIPYPLNCVIVPLFFITISLYFQAKWAISKGRNGNIFHVSSHFLSGFMHTLLIFYLFEITLQDPKTILFFELSVADFMQFGIL